MIDDERLCAGCCREEECYKESLPDNAEEFISMADYINKVDLLLTIAELPNNASKKDILRVVYDAKVLQISISATGEVSLRAIV